MLKYVRSSSSSTWDLGCFLSKQLLNFYFLAEELNYPQVTGREKKSSIFSHAFIVFRLASLTLTKCQDSTNLIAVNLFGLIDLFLLPLMSLLLLFLLIRFWKHIFIDPLSKDFWSSKGVVNFFFHTRPWHDFFVCMH